jgi:hypothetical protein
MLEDNTRRGHVSAIQTEHGFKKFNPIVHTTFTCQKWISNLHASHEDVTPRKFSTLGMPYKSQKVNKENVVTMPPISKVR